MHRFSANHLFQNHYCIKSSPAFKYPFFLSPFLQRSFFIRLTRDNKSEKFFKVFYERMKLAQQEIKATVTVNTSDLGSKRKDEDTNDKETPAKKKGQGLNELTGELGKEVEMPRK